jgi:hypothetical protein
MVNRGFSRICGCLAVASGLLGCAMEGQNSEDGVSQSQQAVVGVDEYLYLRCGATGWGADSSTLLTAAGNGVYTIEYNVTADSMVSGAGDQCVVTRTNSAKGWGSSSASFGTTTAGAVTAPGQWSIGAANSQPVSVKYPALGRYRASVDWTHGTVAIAAVSTTPASNYYYLRCNATNWSVGSSNRMTTATNGVSLSYAVSQNWMVTGGDQCVITRTNQLDGWGTSQTTLGTGTSSTLVVSASSAATVSLVSAGQQFTVRYPAVGRYQATFDPTTGKLRVGEPAPDTGLHGAVESLGGNRVRVTYDFSSAAQLQDFVPTNLDATAVSLADGRMVVQNVSTAGDVTNAVRLIKGFKIDSLQYQAQLQTGSYISAYVGTLWDGSWNPQRGYGAIHGPTGQIFVANGQSSAADSTPVASGTLYSGRIDTTDQGLSWTLNGGSAQALAFPYYGGTTRTVVLGGYASTVAFDNVVLEGTVEGMESDGTETNPGVIHGNVVNLDGGRVRITYDFSDPQQKFDFIPNSAGARRELNDGRLIVSHVSNSNDLKIGLYKYKMRVDRITYGAELLAGNHINVYLNTIWDGNWAPTVGCVGIHNLDGRLIVVNGSVTNTSDTTPVTPRSSYAGDVVLSAAGFDWTVNGTLVSASTPCYSGTDGNLGIGGYGADLAFDNVVFEGQLN